jgi:hypothetical protein
VDVRGHIHVQADLSSRGKKPRYAGGGSVGRSERLGEEEDDLTGIRTPGCRYCSPVGVPTELFRLQLRQVIKYKSDFSECSKISPRISVLYLIKLPPCKIRSFHGGADEGC